MARPEGVVRSNTSEMKLPRSVATDGKKDSFRHQRSL
jgi:hypothetical protein